MIQIKNELLKIAALGLVAVILASFNNKQLFDGGTINNPNMVITANTRPPEITATSASGCAGTVIYQWQQSPGGNNFIDILNATAVSYQPVMIITRTQFRRRAICSGVDTAYTNTATIMVQ